MAATPNNFPALLYPAIRTVFYNHLKKVPTHIQRIYTVSKSDRAYEVVVPVGAVRDIPMFTGTLAEDEPTQGYVRNVIMQRFAMQIKIDRDLMRDDQTGTVRRFVESLADSARRTRERFGIEPFNFAYSAGANAMPDGLPLISAAHTSTASPTYAYDNRISGGTPVFDYSNAQASINDSLQLTDDRGNPVQSIVNAFLFHPAIFNRMAEVLNSTDRPDTPNRAVSTVSGDLVSRVEGETGRKIVALCSRYLSNQFRWFALDLDLVKKFWMWFDNEPIEFMKASDWNTLQALTAVTWRCGRAPADWRGVWGSNATA